MSDLGQKRKCSLRAFDVRSDRDSGRRADMPGRPVSATSRLMHRSKVVGLFDHLVKHMLTREAAARTSRRVRGFDIVGMTTLLRAKRA